MSVITPAVRIRTATTTIMRPSMVSSFARQRQQTAAGLVMIMGLMAATAPSVAVAAAPQQSVQLSSAPTTPVSSPSSPSSSSSPSLSSSSSQRPLRLFVTGGTGGTGLEIIRQAIAAGYDVTVIARSPNKITLSHPNLHIIKGDATNAADVTRAMTGNYDGVLNALGTASLTELVWQTGAFVEEAGTEALISAMKATGNTRLIVCTSNGVAESRQFTPWYLKKAWSVMFAPKDNQEAMVRASDLQWTIVRPTALVNDAPRGVTAVQPVIDGPTVRSYIARADVAAFMLAQVTSPEFIHQAPGLSWRDAKYSWQFW